MARPAHIGCALVVLAVALAAPSPLRADVAVTVPRPFLGGPITPPPAPPAAGTGAPSAPVAAADCGQLAADSCQVWGAAADEDLVVAGPDTDVPPSAIPVVADPATGEAVPAVDLTPVPVTALDEDPSPPVRPAPVVDDVRRPAVTVAPPSPAEVTQAAGGLVAPAAASWLFWQTPRLRWRGVVGADYYNVQVFRGGRRVLNAWTRRPTVRIRRGVLEQGRSYTWSVFPGTGAPALARFGAPVGRSTFQVTLRPRIVLRPAAHGGGLDAEVRPHIPYGVLALAAPRDLAGRVPARVTVDARGRFTLPLSVRQGERLRAVLRDRGPRPPVGLRG